MAPAVMSNLNILLIINRAKIDEFFLEAEFEIDGFTTPYIVDRDSHGGGMLLCYCV